MLIPKVENRIRQYLELLAPGRPRLCLELSCAAARAHLCEHRRPGVTIPIEAIVAVAVIAIVHETAHGVMCVIAKLRLQSSGALLLGWLPIGAFVEPDEKAFKRLKEKERDLFDFSV